MNPDPEQLQKLAAEHKWFPLIGLILWWVVRLLKSDTKIPIDIPPTARIWLAIGLAGVATVIDKLAQNVPWESAIVDGLLALFFAVMLQETVIASLRAGKEIPVPGLMIPGAAPTPGAPITVPPEPLDAKKTPVTLAVISHPEDEEITADGDGDKPKG